MPSARGPGHFVVDPVSPDAPLVWYNEITGSSELKAKQGDPHIVTDTGM